jgi:hypothetical protein
LLKSGDGAYACDGALQSGGELKRGKLLLQQSVESLNLREDALVQVLSDDLTEDGIATRLYISEAEELGHLGVVIALNIDAKEVLALLLTLGGDRQSSQQDLSGDLLGLGLVEGILGNNAGKLVVAYQAEGVEHVVLRNPEDLGELLVVVHHHLGGRGLL